MNIKIGARHNRYVSRNGTGAGQGQRLANKDPGRPALEGTRPSGRPTNGAPLFWREFPPPRGQRWEKPFSHRRQGKKKTSDPKKFTFLLFLGFLERLWTKCRPPDLPPLTRPPRGSPNYLRSRIKFFQLEIIGHNHYFNGGRARMRPSR